MSPYTVRPSDTPPSPALRAVAAYLLADALNTPGSNGDPLARAFAGMLAKGAAPDPAAKVAYGRAVYEVAGSDVLCPGWRDGDPGHWMDGTRFHVDYHPDAALLAVEALYTAAGHPKPRVYPMKTSVYVEDDCVAARWGFGAKVTRYYPLDDGGSVLVARNGVTLSPALARALALSGDVYPDVEVHEDLDWVAYARTLGDTVAADLGPRYAPRVGDTLTARMSDTVWTVVTVDTMVHVEGRCPIDGDVATTSGSLEDWATDYGRPDDYVWARPAAGAVLAG